ncbi:MAG: hypothetical protein GF308_11140 [Candidatus Heimdallarchaeota archaeon]|nr:hypothetical protein [Candidatus Heimdallarchaeota archaeon]
MSPNSTRRSRNWEEPLLSEQLTNQTTRPEKVDVIVPTRGTKKSKRRLRKELGEEKTTRLVKQLLLKTVEELQSCEIINKIIILTPQPETLGQLFPEEEQEKGKLCIQVDQKDNLNSSLKRLWLAILREEIATLERIVILMPDIPSINCKMIKKFVRLTPEKHLGLFPLQQEGTAMVLLNKTVHNSFNPRFGPKSFQKFLQASQKREVPVKLFSVKEELTDIDELADLKRWLAQKESQSTKEGELKKEWHKILGSLNNSEN